MKIFLLIITLTNFVYSQSVQLFNIDASNYPLIKSNILLLDVNGNVIYSPNKDYFNLFENGIEREVISLECGNIPEKKATSTILSMDLSLSMKGISFNLAIQGANSLIELINSKSEVAISGFSDDALLVNDFTSDKNLLLTSLGSMILLGGTNFEKAFLNKDNGAIALAKRAKNQPIIIFLTDGVSTGKYQEVIDEAKKINAIVYSIVLFNEVPKFLEEVSNNTGGIIYDNVTTLKQIVNIYQTIYKLSEIENTCSIEWFSNNCDIERTVNYNYSNSNNSSKYKVEENLLSSFYYPNSQFYSFNDTKINTSGRRILKLEARVDTLVIDSIVSSNSKFKIVLPTGINYPITIPKDTEISLFIDFEYDEEGFQFSEFTINSNVCQDNTFFASGGKPEGANESYIDIIEPNGGEIYYRGADSLIKWQANYPDDKLLIEFSSDNGNKWQEVVKQYSGYSYKYKYPFITSNECLIRITKLSDSSAYEYKVINTDSINNTSISWQKSGLNLILGGNDGYIRFVSGFNHSQTKKIYAHPVVTDVEWSPDAIRFASAGSDGKIKLWLDNNDTPVDSIQAYPDEVSVIEWSPDGSKILSGDKYGNLKVWNSSDLSIIKTEKVSQKSINDIRFSPNGSKIAIALGDTSISVLFASNYLPVSKYPVHRGEVTSLDWLDNDRLVSVSSQAFNNQLIISSSNLGAEVYSFKVNETLSKVRANLDSKLFTFTGDRGKTYIYSADDYSEKYDINSESSWRNNDLCWSPDNSRIAVSSFGKNSGQTVKFNAVDQYPEFRTTSNSNFSLVNANIDINGFDFGKVLINRTKVDSITNFIKITSLIPVKIDSIRLLNDFNNVFTIQSIKNISLESDKYLKLEVSFTPKSENNYNSRIEIFTELNKYSTSISGIGYSNGIKDYNLDFGEVELNTPIRKQLEISNSSINDIIVDSIRIVGPDLISYKIIQGGASSTLKSNNQNTKLLVFEFETKQALRTNSIALIYFNEENAPSRISLSGIGIKPELEFTFQDTLISECNLNKTFEIKFRNNGKSILQISDLSANNINFDKFNFEISPSSEEIIIATINENNSGTFDLDFQFKSNDNNYIIVKDSINFINNLTEYNYSTSELIFEVNQLNQQVNQELVVTNTGDKLIKWDYQLPYSINNSDFKLINITNIEINKNESSTFIFEYTNLTNNQEIELFDLVDNCNIQQSIKLSSKMMQNSNNIEYQKSYSLKSKCDSILNLNLQIKNLNSENIEISKITSTLEITNNITYPITLKSNIQESILLNLKLTKYGFYSEIITFEINGIEYNIDLEIDREDVRFNIFETYKQVEIKSSQKSESYFVVENLGNTELNWNYISYIFEGVKITDIQPLSTPINSSSTFYFEYSELTPRIVDFLIEDECGKSDSILLEFYLGDIPQFSISIDDINSNVGDEVPLNINLISYDKFDFKEKQGLKFKLSYNPSLLKTSNNDLLYNNGLMYENYTLNFDELKNNKWTIFPNTVLWGNDSTSELNISDIEFIENDETKIIDFTNGLLRVIDLCQIGGTRLYKSHNLPFVEKISPNPISENLSLDIFIPNNSNITIDVFDMNGFNSYSINNQYIADKLKIPIKHKLNNGVYLVKINISDEKTMQIYTFYEKFVVIN